MPNHVINSVMVTGNENRLREMLTRIQNDEHGLGSIDFNKIIPMPVELMMESGSESRKGLEAYIGFIDVYTLADTRSEADLNRIPEESEAAFLKMRTDITPRQWELGKAAFQNTLKFGAPTWYEWSIENWGTKWNAYECFASEPAGESAKLLFQTAWEAPHSVIEELSALYPDVQFVHEWADEDIGQNCGRREYTEGRCIEAVEFENDAEAVSYAQRLWGFEQGDDDMKFEM